ncbi:L-threonylcarbamoyladenylate synthase [uncultured Friedmanniella sp.]|uniref:L-threonylcarbamoyladenylate synthase n=1 Tax=uncultured Friedmanniella sp. TaxID=335381 RepID=UPI0035CB6F92
MSEAFENDRADDSDDAFDEPEPVDGFEDLGTDVADQIYERFDCTSGSEDRAAGVEAARAAVDAGACVVLPTDTVYGIGADAFNGDAVQRLLDAKQRGRDMPPPVLIGDASLIRALASDVPEQAKDLVARHWPGPLTVICTIQPSLRMDLGETGGTIALRVPDHELTREVLRRTGPMAVSSANLSGRPAALTCDDAVEQLGDGVSVYLDGGPLSASGGLPSTIVDFSRHEEGEVLRHGALDVALLRETLPDLIDLVEPEPEPEPEPESEPEPKPAPEATDTPERPGD